MNLILLERTSAGWMAEILGPQARQTIQLFGTNILPTAFTSAAPKDRVLAEIRRLNPGCTVEIKPKEQ